MALNPKWKSFPDEKRGFGFRSCWWWWRRWRQRWRWYTLSIYICLCLCLYVQCTLRKWPKCRYSLDLSSIAAFSIRRKRNGNFPRIKIMQFLLFYRLSGHQFHRIRIWYIHCRMEVSSFIHFQRKNIAMKSTPPFTGKLSFFFFEK